MATGLLILNGEVIHEHTFVHKLAEGADLVLCTDGALRYALRYGVENATTIGDLDSLNDADLLIATERGFPIEYVPSQELPDIEKALDWLVSRAITNVNILGIGGGRVDHTISNLSILLRMSSRFEKVTAFDSENEIAILSSGDTHCLVGWPGRRVSMMPLPSAHAVLTTGLAYPLVNESLELGIRESLSNSFIDDTATVSFARGALALFLQRVRTST